ncbi:MAG: hypothetical protein AMS24_00230 [Chlamydiae bacterium SM23_39]|nr:MAG: hypothetical protein AMS24_00230 [Chlamydiae bacterium SM23_39]
MTIQSIVNEELKNKTINEELKNKIEKSLFPNLLDSLQEKNRILNIIFEVFTKYHFENNDLHLNLNWKRSIGGKGDTHRIDAYKEIVKKITNISLNANQTLKHAKSIAKLIFKDDFSSLYTNGLSSSIKNLIKQGNLKKAAQMLKNEEPYGELIRTELFILIMKKISEEQLLSSIKNLIEQSNLRKTAQEILNKNSLGKPIQEKLLNLMIEELLNLIDKAKISEEKNKPKKNI